MRRRRADRNASGKKTPPRSKALPHRLRLAAGALAAAALLAGLATLSTYNERLGSCWRQAKLLPGRFSTDVDALREMMVPEFPLLERVRENTFEDAVIRISDDPADERLHSVLFCAYYLYPRVLVQTETLERVPDLVPDFAVCTPHFCIGDASLTGLVAISERGKRHLTEIRTP